MTRSTTTTTNSACDQPRPNVRARSVVIVVLLSLFFASCQSTTRTTGRVPLPPPTKDPTEPVAQISNTDPCATRLHDICEPLLLYYLMNHKLPGRIEDLREIPGYADIDLTCPVSHRKYLYNPIGLLTAEAKARIILYDPAPSHSGMRWAVSIVEPQEENGPLVTKVIALPESHFTFMGDR